jgi:hypothetical protein
MSNFTSSIEPVGVPTPLGYAMLLPPMVGDGRTVSTVSLLRSELANNLRVGDFPAALLG